MNKAPVFFISHGAPTFALEPGVLGPHLRTLGTQLSGVTAVLVVSPHWQTRDVRVMTTTAPQTVHDFGGFASKLYELQYPALGHPQLAAETGRLLTDAGYALDFDERRGLDHGAWVPLFHLLPDAKRRLHRQRTQHRGRRSRTEPPGRDPLRVAVAVGLRHPTAEHRDRRFQPAWH